MSDNDAFDSATPADDKPVDRREHKPCIHCRQSIAVDAAVCHWCGRAQRWKVELNNLSIIIAFVMAFIAVAQMYVAFMSASYMREDVENAKVSEASAVSAAQSAKAVEHEVDRLKTEVDDTATHIRSLMASNADLQSESRNFPFYVIFNKDEGIHSHFYFQFYYEELLDCDGYIIFFEAVTSGIFDESYTMWKDLRRNALDTLEVAILEWLSYKSHSDYFFNRPSGWRYTDKQVSQSDSQPQKAATVYVEDLNSLSDHNRLLANDRRIFSNNRSPRGILIPADSTLTGERTSETSGIITIEKPTFRISISYKLAEAVNITDMLKKFHAPIGTNIKSEMDWQAIPINMTVDLVISPEHIGDLTHEDFIYAKRLPDALERNFSWPELWRSLRLVPSDQGIWRIFNQDKDQ